MAQTRESGREHLVLNSFKHICLVLNIYEHIKKYIYIYREKNIAKTIEKRKKFFSKQI